MKRYCKKHKISVDEVSAQNHVIAEEKVQNGISFEDKLEFAEKIRKVSHEVLGEIILMV
jgi:hypothetical protein